jgi:hypothetical protein
MGIMKTPFGQKLLLAVLSLGVAFSIVLGVRQSIQIEELKSRAALSKKALDELTANVLAESERAGARRNTTASSENEGGPGQNKAIFLKLNALGRRLDAIESGNIEEIEIGEMVDNRVNASAGGDKAGRPHRLSIDALASKLGMTDEQKEKAAQVINDARTEVVKLLDEPGPDGRAMTEQIAEIMKGPGRREDKNRQLFAAMSGNNVPGTDESYISAISGIRERATSAFRGNLSDEQIETLSNSRFKLLGIDTGYSPFASSVREKLRGGGR